jgi:hypothetical protein
MRECLPPVARIRHGAENRWAQRGTLSGFEQAHRRGDRDQHEGERGQQPARATLVEPAEPDATVFAVPGDKQVGDQVPAEHEEDIHAKEAAGNPRQSLVERQYCQDSERTDPIKPRYPRCRCRRRGSRFSRHRRRVCHSRFAASGGCWLWRHGGVLPDWHEAGGSAVWAAHLNWS